MGQALYDALSEHPYSNTVAAMGSTSWVWFPYIEAVSKGAALILPILSVLWLGIQIYSHIKKGKK